MQYDPKNNAKRWVGYFDLLGTSDLIRSDCHLKVFSAYNDALGQLKRWENRNIEISRAWFSDTFLLFSENDSIGSFDDIEIISRYFVFALLMKDIPVNGAIACDEFYVDNTNKLYFGKALLEAYEYGEQQDWIGLLLCPSAVNHLNILEKPVDNIKDYTFYEKIPFKKEFANQSIKPAACILGKWMRPSDRNGILDKLKEMASKCNDDRIRAKYERAISFIEIHDK